MAATRSALVERARAGSDGMHGKVLKSPARR